MENDADVHLFGASVKNGLTNIGASVIMDLVMLGAIVRDFLCLNVKFMMKC